MHNINGLKLAVPNFPSLKGGFDSRIPLKPFNILTISVLNIKKRSKQA